MLPASSRSPAPPPSLPRANTDCLNHNPSLLPTPLDTPIKSFSGTASMIPIQHRYHPSLARASSTATPPIDRSAMPSLRNPPLQPSTASSSSYSPPTPQSDTPEPIAGPPPVRRADTLALVSPAVDSTLQLAGQSLATGLDVAARRADIFHDLEDLAEHQHFAYHHLGGAIVHHQLHEHALPSHPTSPSSSNYFQHPQRKSLAFESTSSATHSQPQHLQRPAARTSAVALGIRPATAAHLLPPAMERHISVPSVLPSWLQPTSKPNSPPQNLAFGAADVSRATALQNPLSQSLIDHSTALSADLVGRDRDPRRAASPAWEQHQQLPPMPQLQQTQGAMQVAAVPPQWSATGPQVHMQLISQASETFQLLQEHPGTPGLPVASSESAQQPSPSSENSRQVPTHSHGRSAVAVVPAMSHPPLPTTPHLPTPALADTVHSPHSPFTLALDNSPALGGYPAVPHNSPVAAQAARSFVLLAGSPPLVSPHPVTFLALVPPNTPTDDDADVTDVQAPAATPRYRIETTDSFDPTAPVFAGAPMWGPGDGRDFGRVGVLRPQPELHSHTPQICVPLNLFGGGAAGIPPAAVPASSFVAQGGQPPRQGPGGQQQAGYVRGFTTSSNVGMQYSESHDWHQQLSFVPGLNFTMGGGHQHQHHHHHTSHPFGAHPNAAPLTPDPMAFALNKKLQPLVWSPTPNPVIRINNISWDMTIFDIQHYLHPLSIARLGGLPLIHILMVRETGKTRADAYVELDTMNDAMVALRERQRRVLRGRVVTLHRASQAELLRLVFPSFVGEFHLVDAVPAGEREPGEEVGVATSYVAMQRMMQEHNRASGRGQHDGGSAAGANAAWLDAFARLALPGVGAGRGGDSSRNVSLPGQAGECMASSSSLSSSASACGNRLASRAASSTQGSPTVIGQASSTRNDFELESAHRTIMTQPPTPAPPHMGGNEQAQVQKQAGHGEYVFLTRTEIQQILSVCKNYKLFFSRKCSQRPFENVIVILLKFPWHQRHLLSTVQRDQVFELTKLAIESLQSHLLKPTHAMDPTLLDRMVRAALLVPAFTDRQKATVLEVAGKLAMAKCVGLEDACRDLQGGEVAAAAEVATPRVSKDRRMASDEPLYADVPPMYPQPRVPLPSTLVHQARAWTSQSSSHAAAVNMLPPRHEKDDAIDVDKGDNNDDNAIPEVEFGFGVGFGVGGAGPAVGAGSGNENTATTLPRPLEAAYQHSQATHGQTVGGLSNLSPTAPAFRPRNYVPRMEARHSGESFQLRPREETAGPARSVEGDGVRY